MIDGITYLENFISDASLLFEHLKKNIDWDERMKTRKTASFGLAYNYSQIIYPSKEMLPKLKEICILIEKNIGFKPNNCLINLYPNGKSKMGFHSDQIDILNENTGIVIISLGEKRALRYRKIANKDEKFDIELSSGSLIYMTQGIQKIWQHAIPKSKVESPRMSLTFRYLKN